MPNLKRRFDLLDRLDHRLSMGPLKKSKPSQAPTDNINTDATAEGTATAACKNSPQILSASPPARSSDQTEPSEADAGADGGAKTASVSSEQKHLGKKPWLGGSWKSKALPVAEVVRESASSGGTVSDRPATTASRDVPSSPVPYLNKSMRRSSKGSVLTASTTKLNVASTQSNDPRPKDALPDPPLPPDPVETAHKGEVDASKQGGDDAKAEQDVQKPLAATAGWRGWWSKPDNQRAASREAKETSESLETSTDEPARTPLPCSTPTEEAPDRGRLGEPSESSTLVAQEPGDEAAASATAQGAQDRGSQSRSWFWFWSNAQNARDDQESSQHDAGAAPENMSKDIPKADEPPSITVTAEAEPQKPQDSQATPPKSSGWVFWSRARVESDTASDAGSTHKEVGELAVSDTPSQSKPEAAQFNQHEENGTAKQPLKDRGRQRVKETTSQAPTPSKTSPTHSPSRKVSKLAQQTRPNLLLPAFNSTYQLAQTPSYWHQLRSYVYGSISEPARLCINPSPPRIKKALAIGIHGYFPAPLVQRVLGQPTGTSIRFANHAAASIEAWTAERGYKCAIEKVALEGEGFIADRVDTLWKLLLNWIEQIREADFILVAAHSQGVPVSVMLVAKLIEFGCVGAARIGICAMAGVNLGPFAEYKFRFVGSLAQELFEFSSPDSTVSKLYEQALEKVVKAEVKIVYVGSIDDQLVPLESAIFATVSHPFIYRAVFVDGRLHTPDFISSLVGFCLRLRNLGIPDHGLIRELSPALAGSLYGGEGHSRVYDDDEVYALAVRHTLETTVSGNGKHDAPGTGPAMALRVERYEGPASAANGNPYVLPWAMRGLLEEEYVKRECEGDVKELLALFEEWRPVSKGLKDVKFRLEAVRSGL